MTHSPIHSVDEAVENIARYQAAVTEEPELAVRMKHVRAWYAVGLVDGTWSFGPSKFIGYANVSAGAYLSDPALRNPRQREAALRKWFDVVPHDTPFGVELADALQKFLNAHGHPGPRRNAWICAPKDLLNRCLVPFNRTFLERNPFVRTRPFPLENGDRLTRQEFERRYSARPDVKKAELIEGVVHMPSPVRFASHGEPHSWILAWLTTYSAHTPWVRVADNATVRLDSNNEPQPDALLRIEPQAGGRSRLSDDDYVEGAPELIVEIASSSVAYDLHDKLRAYLRNGVREYVVWRVYDGVLDWLVLKDGDYVPSVPDATVGGIRSEVFPGLRLAVNALLAGDVARVLAVLQEGLGTTEHAEFVKRLRTARSMIRRRSLAR